MPLTLFFFDVLHVDGADLIDLPARERCAAIGRVAAGGAARAAPRHRRRRRRAAGVPRRRARARARGRDGEVARRALRGRPPRRRLAEGQAACTRSTSSCSRPNGATAGGRAGSRTCISARATRRRRLRDARQDVQGPDRRDARVADRALLALESRTATQRRSTSAAARRRDRVRRLQTSPRYPGGVALRFARVLRYRDDKRPTKPTRSRPCASLHAARPGWRRLLRPDVSTTGRRRSEGIDPMRAIRIREVAGHSAGRISPGGTDMKPIKLVAVFAALAIACVALAGAAGAASTAGTKVSAKLTVKSEVPAPKGGKGTGSFTGHADGQQARLEADLGHALRARERSAHPPRQGRQGRQRRGAAVRRRDLQVGRPRHGDAQGRGAEGAQERRHVRERAHGQEPGRRDPRSDRGRRSGEARGFECRLGRCCPIPATAPRAARPASSSRIPSAGRA